MRCALKAAAVRPMPRGTPRCRVTQGGCAPRRPAALRNAGIRPAGVPSSRARAAKRKAIPLPRECRSARQCRSAAPGPRDVKPRGGGTQHRQPPRPGGGTRFSPPDSGPLGAPLGRSPALLISIHGAGRSRSGLRAPPLS